MANQLVDTNFMLNDRALSAQTKLNAGSRLRLYKSNITPTPASVLASFTPSECNFDGYTIQTLNPNWATPFQFVSGVYRMLSAVLTYSSPVTTGNTIYGLFTDDGAGNLLFAMLFDTAITYTVGSPALAIQLGYEVRAEETIP